MSENKRLTWNDIQKQYPDQWLGLTEVEYELDNDAAIKSAIVTYTDKSKDELTLMMLQSKCKVVARYTTPDNVCPLGMIGGLL